MIVLAWTDEPGNVTTGDMPVLVRDLDLSVANLCTRYTGNFIGSDDFSSAFGCSVSPLYASRNNVENQPFAVFFHNGY